MSPFRRLVTCLVLVAVLMPLVACGAGGAAASPEATANVPTPRPTFTPASGATSVADEAETATTTEGASDEADATSEADATAEPTATVALPEVKSLSMSSPEYGMQIFPWWRPEVGSRDLQMISAAGFTWAKVNFGWRDIEGAAKGTFDWSRTDQIVEMANNDGIDLLVRVDNQPEWAGGNYPTNGAPDDPQDLADFFTALATRYEGRIRAYEVWNEPNLAREWGGVTPDPVAYAEMLKLSYAAIKAADPNAMVISAGLSPTGTWDDSTRPDDWYLETLYIAMGGNGSAGYLDVLGLHAPGYAVAPETDPAQVEADASLGGSRVFCFRHIEDLRAIMVEYGDAAKQIAILEFGWTSDPRADSPYNWHMVSEDAKADYLVRAYQYAEENWSPWIGLMSLIYISDPDWTAEDEQYWWAISDPSYPDFTPRAAYTALKAMAK